MVRHAFRTIISAVFFLNSTYALGTQCPPLDSVDSYQHVFLARVTAAKFVPWTGNVDKHVGVVIGEFAVEEIFKGDPAAVPHFESRIDRDIFYQPITVPVGYRVVVYSRNGGPHRFEACQSVRILRGGGDECFLYRLRKEVGLGKVLNEGCEVEYANDLAAGKRRSERRLKQIKRNQERDTRLRQIIEEAGYSYKSLQ